MSPLPDPNTLTPLTLLVITLGYSVSCALWPFKPCRRCDGRGHFRSSFLHAVRLCRPCHGSGLRLRLGRKAWNTYRQLRHDNRKDTRPHDRDDR